ncbi:MAG: alanine racemase [Bacteroidales bacterium]|jgi:alanine racemase|nr:alanine racemase [Bacteroidales bacterium]
MTSTSEIILNCKSFEKNIGFIRSLLDEKTIISAVVKGNSYGHGTHIVVPILERMGINHFSVYSSPEAKDAFYARTKDSTIMILGFVYDNDYKWIIKNNIEFYISGLEELNKAIAVAKELELKAIIHIDVETGMNRTGLPLSKLKEAIAIINANREHLIIRGITTHFAGAESIANYTRIRKQLKVFKSRVKLLNKYNIYSELQHVASSAATINYPDTRMDLVRTGILIYGYWPTRESFIQYIHRKKDRTDPLERVLSWKSQLISVKRVSEGEFVGYGMSFQAIKETVVGIVPVGYSNGYSRSLSNNGHILINGQKAPVIGSVNMNMILCDITDIPNVKIGDQAVLIGKDGDTEISFSSFAEMNNSMNYEILARLPENIKRGFVE